MDKGENLAAKSGGTDQSPSGHPAAATKNKAGGGGSTQYIVAALSVVLSAIAVYFIIGGGLPLGGGGDGSSGWSGGGGEQEVLPPADARATIKFKKPIEAIWDYVALPSTWPLWQAGWDQVSGEIDTVAEAGNRVRAHLAGGAGHGANREILWR